MNSKFILLSVMLVSVAVGFVLINAPEYTEEINVASGAQYEETVTSITEQYGIPDDILYTEPVATVAFSHETHAVNQGFKCSTCHSGIFQMQAKSVQSKPDFNMQGLADGKYCGSCHSAEHEVAFGSDSQCARCHIGVTGLEAEMGLEPDDRTTVLEADSGDTGDQADNG